ECSRPALGRRLRRSATSTLVEPPHAPDLAPQRERLPELDPDHRPRLRGPAGVRHHAQDTVDAEPEGVGVGHFVFDVAHSTHTHSALAVAAEVSMHRTAMAEARRSRIMACPPETGSLGSGGSFRSRAARFWPPSLVVLLIV